MLPVSPSAPVATRIDKRTPLASVEAAGGGATFAWDEHYFEERKQGHNSIHLPATSRPTAGVVRPSGGTASLGILIQERDQRRAELSRVADVNPRSWDLGAG
jgi:hypothetical protein